MIKTFNLLLAASFLFLASSCKSPSSNSTSGKAIFDGKSLQGWDARGEADFKIEDGAIVGRTGKGGHGWLCTAKPHADFLLELEVKIDAGNAGIQIRSHFEQNEMIGYQIEVDSSARAWSGGLYEQGRRGWLQNLKDNEPARNAFKKGEWNHYKILCVGPSIKTWVNGVPAADYLDSMELEGLIALQVHSGKNVEVRYRNIRLKDLGAHAWKPLWNGKDFKGWHPNGMGEWQVKDGAIIGTHVPDRKDYGNLVSDAKYKDFTTRVKYKLVKGNSGFYFRSEEKGINGMSGIHVDIDSKDATGGLYETNGRGWVKQPAPDEVKKFVLKKDWNMLSVSAYGNRVAVDINGYRTAELKNDTGRTNGHFALQTHGGMDVEVQFKDLEILTKVR